MTKKFLGLAAAALITLVTATVAHAGFVGRTLSAEYFYPDLSTPYGPATVTPSPFVVGPGPETSINVEGVTTIVVDVTDTTLRFDFATILAAPTWNSTPFNGVVFNLVTGAPLSLLSASIDPSSTLGGLDASRVAFNDSQVTVNWSGLPYSNGTFLLINVASAAAVGAVPEPGTLALLAIALAALGTLRRQKLPVAGRA